MFIIKNIFLSSVGFLPLPHRFFSLQATESLGFDYAIRCEVENQICREGGPLAHCFQQPMDAVVSLMEKV